MLLQNYFQKYAKAYSESCEASKVELKQKQLTDFSRELFSQKVHVSECSKYAPDMEKLRQVLKASVLENN